MEVVTISSSFSRSVTPVIDLIIAKEFPWAIMSSEFILSKVKLIKPSTVKTIFQVTSEPS